jgi:two-component system LytT family response regulator
MNSTTTNILDTLIVDDEALARRGLKHRLQHIPDINVVGEARNGRDALSKVRELAADELPSVVFVTAFDEFAVKAFEAKAIDYILKPIENERLLEALDKVRDRQSAERAKKDRRSLLNLVSEIAGEHISSMEEVGSKSLSHLKKSKARLAIKDGGKTTWVQQEDIEWIDAAEDYMFVHASGETHIMRKTMKELDKELDSNLLQRIHRSTIVNVKQVKEMQSHINGEYFLTLKGGHTLKLSRTYKDKLKFFS